MTPACTVCEQQQLGKCNTISVQKDRVREEEKIGLNNYSHEGQQPLCTTCSCFAPSIQLASRAFCCSTVSVLANK